MRNVIFVANGKEFKTYAEAREESKYVDTKLSEDFNPEPSPKFNARKFGEFTGKLAEGWKAPYQRV